VKVSIITTCLNAAKFISAAMASVGEQSYRNLEHVITDGGSTDGTLQLVEERGARRDLSVVYDSRPDKGIYDGLNRAIGLATGEIIGICNADDLMLPSAVEAVVDLFHRNPSVDMVTAGVSYFLDGRQDDLRQAIPARQMSLEGLAFGLPAINGRFVRRDAYERFGLFSQELPLAADRIWLMQAAQAGLSEAVLGKVIYRYRMHAESQSMGGDTSTRQRLRNDHLTMTRKLLAQADEGEMARVCREFRAIEGTKLMMAGASARAVAADLRGLDPDWTMSALKAIVPWLRWRGKHSNA